MFKKNVGNNFYEDETTKIDVLQEWIFVGFFCEKQLIYIIISSRKKREIKFR